MRWNYIVFSSQLVTEVFQFFNERNDRAATKDDDEDEEDVEDALFFGMSVLSFCACMADHCSVLALPNMNSPDPKYIVCVFCCTLLKARCALYATAKLMYSSNFGEVKGERRDEVDRIEVCRI